jgi:cell division protein FtsW (lipid II flippase)
MRGGGGSNEVQWGRLPLGLLAVALIIPLIGVVNLHSAAQATRPNLYLIQLGWLAVATGFGAAVAWLDTRSLRFFTVPFYVLVVTLLILVLAIGTPIKGSQRWLNLGFFNLQPSELAKLCLILVSARYFSSYRVPGGYTLRHLLRPLNISRPLGAAAIFMLRFFAEPEVQIPLTIPERNWTLFGGACLVLVVWIALALWQLAREGMHHRQWVAPVDVILLPWALVLIEPDLGTSLILLAIAGSIILFCGMRPGSLAIAGGGVVATALFGWNVLLKPYQKKRVETFLNPEADARGAGYHATQSKIAIGSGELTGKGWGEGTQTQLSFLPENHTDFVFSVLAEEWGFVGAAALVGLFFLLVALMIRTASRAPDRFGALVCVGSAAMIFWHVVVNIGMVTGLMPVVGSTLPLMSYGGSSMITQVLAVALVVNIALHKRS